MATEPEQQAGITYAELGISVDRCRAGDCKTHCPKCHGSRRNQSDKSLSVNIDDGQWKCHHCQWQSGLTKEAQNAGRKVEMVSTPTFTPNVAPRPLNRSARPTPVERTFPTEPQPWAIDWLIKERGFSAEVIKDFQIGSSITRKDGEEKKTIHLPYVYQGEIVNYKHRVMPKSWWQKGRNGESPVLFNLDAAEGAKTIVVCEGELDVIACHMAGWIGVSSPDGAPGEVYDHSTEPPTPTGKVAEVGSKADAFLEPRAADILGAADRIIIATDDDLEGRKLGDHLVELFGAVKCWRVKWSDFGAKDANELLLKQGVKKLDEALSKARPVPLPGVRSLSAQKEALLYLYDNGYAKGVTSGWPEFDHYFTPEPGKLVVVSGYPGHGKTSWLNHFFMNLARLNNWNIGLYSPEMGEEGEMLGKFVQIALDAPFLPGSDKQVAREALETAIDWVGDRFWEIYCDESDNEGFASLTVPQILTRAEPLVLKHGLKVLDIDPWNQLESSRGKGMTVDEYIAVSLSTIQRWGKRMGVMPVIVIHPRKPDSIKSAEEKGPEAYEAAGAAHWYNMADVFLSIHRDKSTADGLTTVTVKKHRKEGITGNLGSCQFKYHKATGRFIYHEEEFHEIGSQPYPEMPSHLYDASMLATAQLPAAWEEVPF